VSKPSSPTLPPGFGLPTAPETAALAAALASPPPVSIRQNPHKQPLASTLALAEPIPWCPGGYYLVQRPSFTLDPAHHAGAYYVQEASSMLVAEAVRQLLPAHCPPLLALDLCAAPGGKTTLLAEALPPGSELIANEPISKRALILRENVLRWGAGGGAGPLRGHIRVCRHRPEELAQQLGEAFDLILVDAPCSGEGLWRRQPEAMDEWSPAAVQACALRQQDILAQAWRLLKPGGWLLYSTCTYSTQENTENLAWLLAQHPQARSCPLQLPEAWGFVPLPGPAQPLGWQAYPHRVRGEGFYLAAVQKGQAPPTPTEWASPEKKKKTLPTGLPGWIRLAEGYEAQLQGHSLYADYPSALPPCRLHWLLRDLPLASPKGADWVPTHELAMHPHYMHQPPQVELSREQALAYLRGRDPQPDCPKGWQLATYHQLPLGWLKQLGTRCNNYLPRQLHIRMEQAE